MNLRINEWANPKIVILMMRFKCQSAGENTMVSVCLISTLKLLVCWSFSGILIGFINTENVFLEIQKYICRRRHCEINWVKEWFDNKLINWVPIDSKELIKWTSCGEIYEHKNASPSRWEIWIINWDRNWMFYWIWQEERSILNVQSNAIEFLIQDPN